MSSINEKDHTIKESNRRQDLWGYYNQLVLDLLSSWQGYQMGGFNS